MAYPDLPFPDYTWRISHHQGILTSASLHTLLWAASTYQGSRDAAQEITNYLVINGVVPANIRTDSRQADVWRDYQQLLSELGLMYSTRRRHQTIRLTQAGIAYLDGTITFTDLMTTQALRFQYPNGHHTQKSPRDSSQLNFAQQQQEAGVALRPAAIVWFVLQGLLHAGIEPSLSSREIEHFAIPLISLQDVPLALESLILFRRSPVPLRSTKRRRNASDWIKRLSQTILFVETEGQLSLSTYSRDREALIGEWLLARDVDNEFWKYPTHDRSEEAWANWYGTLTADSIPDLTGSEDYGSEQEPDEDANIGAASPATTAAMPFDFTFLTHEERNETDSLSISSVYSAALSNSAHRQHDAMLRLIAETCRNKKAQIFSDPSTFDLLVRYDDLELLIEVKSASARNLHQKVRIALGQVSYYDFLRSKETEVKRRRAVALTLGLDDAHWAGEFLSGYMDVDLITLREGRLHTRSTCAQVATLLA